MDWLRKHTDTVIILGGIVSAMIWMNGKFNQLQKDVAIIKTVMLLKGILPPELVAAKGEST